MFAFSLTWLFFAYICQIRDLHILEYIVISVSLYPKIINSYTFRTWWRDYQPCWPLYQVSPVRQRKFKKMYGAILHETYVLDILRPTGSYFRILKIPWTDPLKTADWFSHSGSWSIKYNLEIIAMARFVGDIYYSELGAVS